MSMNRPLSWSIAEIVEATSGTLLCGNRTRSFPGISIDSRIISDTDLFIAIKGKIHDGHSFIEDLISRGVCGFLINNKNKEALPISDFKKKEITCVCVPDTIKALGDLALFRRKQTEVSVVAITGSNGKTTTRAMTTSILKQRFNILATIENFNNEIGLPLTIFRLERDHQWAVLEIGMNHLGEIKRLAQICAPDVGVITNIGPVHLEGVGSIKGVLHAKGELLDEIKPDGMTVLNVDDQRTDYLVSRASTKVLLFGLSEKAVVRGESVKQHNFGTTFTLTIPTGTVSIKLGIPGDFMVSNALASAATGYLLGLTVEEIKSGIESFKPVWGRMNIIKTKRGIHIIDDTYNANPDSMKAAMSVLRSLKGKKRGFFVAGDMHELGDQAELMHKMIGFLSAGSSITQLYVSGKYAEVVAEGALQGDMDSRNIFTGSKVEILENLTESLYSGDWVLVKGSRKMGMENIVKGLEEWGNA